MRNVEKKSKDQSFVRSLYEKTDLSFREIGRRAGVDAKTVKNWAAAGSWVRGSAPFEDVPQPFRTTGEAAAKVLEQLTTVSQPVEKLTERSNDSPRTAQEIAREFCGTVDVLRAEIDTVVRNLHLIRDLAECDLDSGEDDKATEARRRMIAKVLELPGLVKASNDLTAALSRLTEADPGKKEQQKQNAKSAATGRFETPSAPGARDRLQ